MTDIVRYRLPCRFLGGAMHALVVRRDLEQLFDYRALRIRELLGEPASQ